MVFAMKNHVFFRDIFINNNLFQTYGNKYVMYLNLCIKIKYKKIIKTLLSIAFAGPGFETEDDMLDFIYNQSLQADSKILGGIAFYNEFDGTDNLPTNITYSIRLKSGQRNLPLDEQFSSDNNASQWRTDQRFPPFQLPGPREKNDTYGGTPGTQFNNSCVFTGQIFTGVEKMLSSQKTCQIFLRTFCMFLCTKGPNFPPKHQNFLGMSFLEQKEKGLLPRTGIQFYF